MLLAPDHPAYPVRLANVEPKRTLTTSGPLDHTGIAVAIVGSREPIPEAVAFTRDLARRLARANVLVLSGGAVGIDSAAHEAALENGTTWCVAPSGRDRPFPEENAELFARIAASERSRMIWPFPDDQGKTTETPKQRNAILVALAKVVVVVQAHVQSGSRNAITHARRMRKPLFIVPAAPWTTSFGGSLWELCRGGAYPLAHASQLFRYLGIPWTGPRTSWTVPEKVRPSSTDLEDAEPLETPSAAAALSPEESAVISALSEQPQHVDEVIARTGLRASSAITALLTLSLKDVVVEGPDGFYRRR